MGVGVRWMCRLAMGLLLLVSGCTEERDFPRCPTVNDKLFELFADPCERYPAVCESPVEVLQKREANTDRAWDVLFVPAGFTDEQHASFIAQVDWLDDGVQRGPWFTDEEKARFNTYRMDIDAHGAAPPAITEYRPLASCFLWEADSKSHFLTLGTNLRPVINAAEEQVGHAFDVVVVVFNTRVGRANAAGNINLSLGSGAETLVHELGHVLFDLGDEYAEFPGCGTDFCRREGKNGYGLPGTHLAPNLTYEATGEKWADYVDGAIEGGGRFERCVYHPTEDCVMGTGSNRFCPVCRAAVEARFQTDFVERLEGFAPICDVEFVVGPQQVEAFAYGGDPEGLASITLTMERVVGPGTAAIEPNRVEGGPVALQAVPMCQEGVLPENYRRLSYERGGEPKVLDIGDPQCPLSTELQSGGDCPVELDVCERCDAEIGSCREYVCWDGSWFPLVELDQDLDELRSRPVTYGYRAEVTCTDTNGNEVLTAYESPPGADPPLFFPTN